MVKPPKQGDNIYELFYAPVRFGSDAQHICLEDRRMLEEFTRQQIVMAKHYKRFDKSHSQPWTVLCRNWKVRNSKGRFRLLRESVQTYDWIVQWEKQERMKRQEQMLK